MKKEVKIFAIIGMVVMFSSCSNYKYLSDNDVYSQKPTDINLQENETDLTSFNAYKAREKGEFTQEYRDPRLNSRSLNNRFMLIGAYMPMDYYAGMYYGNPYSYGRMGMYDPFMRNPYMGYNYGFGYNYGYGYYGFYGGYPMPYYGNYYSPFNPYDGGGYFYNPHGYGFYNGYSYGYNPYYHNPYNYGGGNYGGGYYGNAYNSNSNSSGSDQPNFYGKRNVPSSSSKRTSGNSTSYSTKSLVETGTPYNNNQSSGTSRRAAGMPQAGGNTNSNSGYTNSTVQKKYDNHNGTTNTSYRRTESSTYTPNTPLRNSGKVNVQRSNGTSVSGTSRGSYNSSTNNRRPASSIRSTPQSRGSFSTGSNNRGVSSPSPSPTRSSGSNNSRPAGRR